MEFDFGQIFHFLFETFEGIGCLVGLGLIVSFVFCIFLERRTKRIYKNHEVEEEDEWSMFDQDE